MNPVFGGPSQGIRNSVPALKELGIENEIVSFDNPEEEFLVKDPFRIHALGPGQGFWRYNGKFRDWFVDHYHRFDVVIIHGLWLYHSYAVLSVINRLKKQEDKHSIPKVFVMPHGMLDPYFQTDPSRRLKAIRNSLYWWFIESQVVNSADGVLFTSEEELKLARKTFNNYKPKRELNIGYGIQSPPSLQRIKAEDISNFSFKLPNKKYILFLSRVDEKKGVDILVKAYLSVKQLYPELPKLVCAGPGIDSDFGVKLKKLANGEPDIIFPGMLSGYDKWNAIYNADAFILPSHQENFGIAVVEALACGIPVLITDKINIWNDIINADAGIVANDTEIGVENLLRQYQNLDRTKRDDMGKNAYEVFEEKFSVKNAALFLKNTLNTLIDGGI